MVKLAWRDYVLIVLLGRRGAAEGCLRPRVLLHQGLLFQVLLSVVITNIEHSKAVLISPDTLWFIDRYASKSHAELVPASGCF
jgi:hypothetical protein